MFTLSQPCLLEQQLGLPGVHLVLAAVQSEGGQYGGPQQLGEVPGVGLVEPPRRHRAGPGQGASFVGAGAAFVVDFLISVVVSVATRPKPDSELVGLVYSLTPKEQRTEVAAARDRGWYRRPVLLAGISLTLIIILNIVFR